MVVGYCMVKVKDDERGNEGDDERASGEERGRG